MNRRTKYLPTEFGPDVRFDVNPATALSVRTRDEALERLKNRLLAERLEEVWSPDHNLLLRRAANEAASLAWITPYPTLVFPTLFEEKIGAGLFRAERQEQIRERSRELLAV